MNKKETDTMLRNVLREYTQENLAATNDRGDRITWDKLRADIHRHLTSLGVTEPLPDRKPYISELQEWLGSNKIEKGRMKSGARATAIIGVKFKFGRPYRKEESKDKGRPEMFSREWDYDITTGMAFGRVSYALSHPLAGISEKDIPEKITEHMIRMCGDPEETDHPIEASIVKKLIAPYIKIIKGDIFFRGAMEKYVIRTDNPNDSIILSKLRILLEKVAIKEGVNPEDWHTRFPSFDEVDTHFVKTFELDGDKILGLRFITKAELLAKK